VRLATTLEALFEHEFHRREDESAIHDLGSYSHKTCPTLTSPHEHRGVYMQPLGRAFYRRHPADVAPDLLGKLLVRDLAGVRLVGRIVETEAYCSDDPASHTYKGLTPRNRAMFGEVGHAYIYFIHGMHYCMNVTAKSEHPAGGVLIRAFEPLEGVPTMQQLRSRQVLRELASGPAKLAQALGIDKQLYGTDMTVPGPLFIADDLSQAALSARAKVQATPRIGVSRATDVLWRFVVHGSPFISK
jgi:DNA-3-methyladenine glycosylase